MGQYSLVETRARMVSKKLVLALEKMIYTVHASFYMLFLIPEQLISFFLYISWIFFYVKTASKDFMIFEKQPV